MMSMHLLGPAFSTTSTKKKKNTSVNINAKFLQEHRDYNKQMRRVRLRSKSLDEYIEYRQGNSKYQPKAVKGPFETEAYRRESPNIPSSNAVGNGFAKPVNVYTGGNLLGIATMHKSNMVPVFRKEDAQEIARMRRG